MGSGSSKPKYWDDSAHQFATTSHPDKYKEPEEIEDAIGRPIPVYMVYTKNQLDATNHGNNVALIVTSIVGLIMSFIGAVLIFHYQNRYSQRDHKKQVQELRDLLRASQQAHANLLANDRNERARLIAIQPQSLSQFISANNNSTSMQPNMAPITENNADWLAPAFQAMVEKL